MWFLDEGHGVIGIDNLAKYGEVIAPLIQLLTTNF
jgi:hypothetical protein